MKGEGKAFYSAEEVIIAYNEKQIDLHANIKVRANYPVMQMVHLTWKLIETTVGRVIFNQFVPKEVGFINALLTKKALREIIGDIIEMDKRSDRLLNFWMILKHLDTVWHSGVDCHSTLMT